MGEEGKKPDITTTDYYDELNNTNFDPKTQIRSDQWDRLDIHNLWSQKALLQERINYLSVTGYVRIAEQMQKTMEFLDARIEEESVHKQNQNNNIIYKI